MRLALDMVERVANLAIAHDLADPGAWKSVLRLATVKFSSDPKETDKARETIAEVGHAYGIGA